MNLSLIEAVRQFLRSRRGENVSFLAQTWKSAVFSFEQGSKPLVIRLNAKDLAFHADQKMYDWLGDRLPIPRIHEIGKFSETLHYAIADRCRGRTLEAEGTFIPETQIRNALSLIHAIPAPVDAGRGLLNAGRKYRSWRDHQIDFGGYDAILFKRAFQVLPVDDQLFLKSCFDEMESLLSYCPEAGCLLHGDCKPENLLADEEGLSGIIDWQDAAWGDPAYDFASFAFKRKGPIDWDFLQRTVSSILPIHTPPEEQLGDDWVRSHWDERIRCYMLKMGIVYLALHTWHQQQEAYDRMRDRVSQLLINGHARMATSRRRSDSEN